MQSLVFLPVILMFVVYVGMLILTFWFVNHLVNKSLDLKREQNALLRELISKLESK